MARFNITALEPQGHSESRSEAYWCRGLTLKSSWEQRFRAENRRVRETNDVY